MPPLHSSNLFLLQGSKYQDKFSFVQIYWELVKHKGLRWHTPNMVYGLLRILVESISIAMIYKPTDLFPQFLSGGPGHKACILQTEVARYSRAIIYHLPVGTGLGLYWEKSFINLFLHMIFVEHLFLCQASNVLGSGDTNVTGTQAAIASESSQSRWGKNKQNQTKTTKPPSRVGYLGHGACWNCSACCLSLPFPYSFFPKEI